MKAKITTLEEKQRLLVLLKNMTEKLHTEIKPLNLLKTKLAAKYQILESKPHCIIDLKELISKVNRDYFNVQNTSTECTPQNIKKIATDTTITNLISQKSHDEHTAHKTVSIMTFGDLDKYNLAFKF